MQLTAVVILCIVSTAQICAVRDVSGVSHRALKQSANSSDSTSSPDVPGVIVVDRGILIRNPDIESIRSPFLEAAAAWMTHSAENSGDELFFARVVASTYRLAITEALVTNIRTVQIPDHGARACNVFRSTTEIVAENVARVFIEVLAQASDRVDFADADVAISALFEVTVSAYALALGIACSSGNFNADTYIGTLSGDLNPPFLKITSLAFALVAPGVSVASINVTATDGVLQVTTVDGRTAEQVLAEADGVSSGPAGGDVATGP